MSRTLEFDGLQTIRSCVEASVMYGLTLRVAVGKEVEIERVQNSLAVPQNC